MDRHRDGQSRKGSLTSTSTGAPAAPSTRDVRARTRTGGRPPSMSGPAARVAAWRGGYLQVSVLVRAPPAGVVKVRLPPDSQVTVPSGFFFTYLYSTAAFGGRSTVARQTG